MRGIKKGKKPSAMEISDDEFANSPAHKATKAGAKIDFNPDAFACAVQNILGNLKGDIYILKLI